MENGKSMYRKESALESICTARGEGAKKDRLHETGEPYALTSKMPVWGQIVQQVEDGCVTTYFVSTTYFVIPDLFCINF